MVDSLEHTKYSYTINAIFVRLMLMIAVKNRLGLMAGEIRNEFFTEPCAENICSTCGQEFGATFDAIVVLKSSLYGFKTASNSFHNLFGEFLRDLDFTPYMTDQYLCMGKPDKHDGYNYISNHVDGIIITEKNP